MSTFTTALGQPLPTACRAIGEPTLTKANASRTCVAPHLPDGLTEHAIDCRISWSLTASGVSYNSTGSLAREGEHIKRTAWASALQRNRRLHATRTTVFVSFSVECYGAWGPAATSLFEVATAHLHNYRDTEFFHWSSARITNYWATALGVCLTREHADINCRLARGDFDRRPSPRLPPLGYVRRGRGVRR